MCEVYMSNTITGMLKITSLHIHQQDHPHTTDFISQSIYLSITAIIIPSVISHKLQRNFMSHTYGANSIGISSLNYLPMFNKLKKPQIKYINLQNVHNVCMQHSEVLFLTPSKFSEKNQIYSTCTSRPKPPTETGSWISDYVCSLGSLVTR